MLTEQNEEVFRPASLVRFFPYTSLYLLDQGVWAEIKVGDQHLPSICGAQCTRSVQASVYNVVAKTWIAPSEPVDDLAQGKERAAARPEIPQTCGEFGTAGLAMEGGPRSLDMGSGFRKSPHR
jgi:hypothetical protein